MVVSLSEPSMQPAAPQLDANSYVPGPTRPLDAGVYEDILATDPAIHGDPSENVRQSPIPVPPPSDGNGYVPRPTYEDMPTLHHVIGVYAEVEHPGTMTAGNSNSSQYEHLRPETANNRIESNDYEKLGEEC